MDIDNQEAVIKAGFGLAILQGLGFDSAPSSSLLSKMQGIGPDGSTAMRDSVIQGINMMLKLYQILSECGIAENWKFVHIVLTDGADNCSKAKQETTSALLNIIGQTIPVNMLKTWFIGVDIEQDRKASREIAELVRSGGENIEFANISDANIEEIFAKLTLSLGLVRRTQVQGVQVGDRGFLSVQEQELALLSLEKIHYVVLFNLDVSGSMAGRWGRVCQSVRQFVKYLGPEDLIAGLVFNENVKLLTEPKMTAQAMIAAMIEDSRFQEEQEKFRTDVKKLSVTSRKMDEQDIWRDATRMFVIKSDNEYRALKNDELSASQNQEIQDSNALKDPNEYIKVGKRLSEDFNEAIKAWKSEENPQASKDNFATKASQIIKDVLKKEKISAVLSPPKNYFCDVCQKHFATKEIHDCEFTDAYNTILRNTNVFKLEELLASLVGKDTWGWEPTKIPERPTYLLKLEEISNMIKNNLPNFKEALESSAQNDKNQWLTYFTNTIDSSLVKSVASASIKRAVSTIPLENQKGNIQFAIENSVQVITRKRDIFKKDSSRRLTFGDMKLLPPNTNFIDNDRIPTVTIQLPPQWKPDNECGACPICFEKFTLFHRRHHCRACGQIICSNCYVMSPVIKYGYLFPVKVCRPCHNNLRIESALLWIEQGKTLASQGYKEDAEKCLFISTCHDRDVSKKMTETGDEFFEQGNYELMMRCYTLANSDLSKWMKLAEKFCQNKDYDAALNCIHTAKTSRNITNMQMITKGDEYINSSVNSGRLTTSDSSLFNEVLSLFCFLEGELRTSDFLLKSAKHEQDGNYSLPAFYLAYLTAKKLTPEDWVQLGKAMLDAKCYRVAIYCYDQAKLPPNKWVDIIEGFINSTPPDYKVALSLVDSVEQRYQPTWKDITVNGDFTYYLTNLRNSPQDLSLDKMLDRYLELVEKKAQTSKMVLCMLFAIAFGNVYELYEETNKYLAQNNFIKAFICWSLSKLIERRSQTWTEFGEHIFNINELEGFRCFAMDSPDLKKLGDQLFERGKYKAALSCYLKPGNKDIESQVFNCARKLTSKDKGMTSLYYTQLFKNGKFINEIVKGFIELYPEGPIKNIIIAAMQKSGSNYDIKALAPLHTEMAMILESEKSDSSIKAAIGALHYSVKHADNKQSSQAEIVRLHSLIKPSASDNFYQMLKTTVDDANPKELARLIFDLDDPKFESISSLYKELISEQNLSELPPHKKCYSYLLSASMKIRQRQFSQALIDLKIALVCYPVGEVPEAVSMMLQNENLQIEAYQNLVSDLTKIAESDFNNLNSFCNTAIPETHHYQSLLKGSPLLTKIRQFENAVKIDSKQDSLKAAIFYLDVCLDLDDAACLAGNLIMTGLHLLQAQKQTTLKGEIYSYRNAIVEIMLGACTASQESLSPSMQIYINKISLIVILQANQNLAKVTKDVLNEQIEQIVQGLVSNILRNARIAPITSLPTSLSCDTIYLDLACRSYTQHYLTNLVNKPSPLCPEYIADYYQFEGAWKKWFNPQGGFDQIRTKAMTSLACTKGWTLEHIQNLMHWPAMTRTPEGWLADGKSKLNFQIKTFSKVVGLKVNESTGNISLMLKEASGDDGLFTSQDIDCVLKFGIKGAIFTTDRADPVLSAHPLQEINYYPQGLVNTGYLSTMLHADYLVKMMAQGVEVSPIAPFNIKKASEGFMRRLPENLRVDLKPLSERENSDALYLGDVHQFWIDAGKLNHSYSEDSDTTTYLFDDVKMELKQRLMVQDGDGDLVDFEDHPDDNTPSAEFARAFTKHYDELGEYFPSLLRLKELVKLNAVCALIQKTYSRTKEIIQNAGVDAEEVKKALVEIKRQVGTYPNANSSNIDNIYKQALRQNGIYNEYNVDYSARQKIKNEIESKLKESDNKILQEIAKILADSFNVQMNAIQYEVQRWLGGSDQQSLIRTIVSLSKKPTEEKFSKIVREIESLGLKTTNESPQLGNGRKCCWIPAVVDYTCKSMRNSRPGGGVHLGANLVQDSPINLSDKNYRTFSLRDLGNMR